MYFNSLDFLIIFLPIFFFLFFLINKKTDLQIYTIIFFSIFFYYVNAEEWILLIFISILANCLFAKFIKKKSIFFFSIFFNLSLLIFYKYFIPIHLNTELSEVSIPLGISFFTFNQLFVLTDLYFRKIEKFEYKKFIFLILFFPHLIAGPFLRYNQIMSQISKEARFSISLNKISFGIFLFVIGLSKKVLLADNLGLFVDSMHMEIDNGHLPSLIQSWTVTLSFTLQLYFDFSGYADMAIGLGLMMGLVLPYNFNSPLKSQNILEFWNRWHITLTNLIREFVYYPICMFIGKRFDISNKTSEIIYLVIIPYLITFTIIGLWHGGTLNFLIFGVYHGFLLIITYIFINYYPIKKKLLSNKLFNVIFLNILVNFGFIFFRSSNFNSSSEILKGMLGYNGIGLPYSIVNNISLLSNFEPAKFRFTDAISTKFFIFIFLVSYCVALFAKNYNYSHKFLDKNYSYNFSNIKIYLSGILFILCLMLSNKDSSFIYFNF